MEVRLVFIKAGGVYKLMYNKSVVNWWSNNLGKYAIGLEDSIRSKYVSMGKITNEFERELASLVGSSSSVCAPSGTAALTLALLASGINSNSLVILPNRTWIGTANAASMLGIECILVDSMDNHQNMSAMHLKETLKNCLKPTTVIWVAINGSFKGFTEIVDICSKYNAKIIVDACQAFMSNPITTRFALTKAEALVYSFGMPKLISTGLGGCLVSTRADLLSSARVMRNQGIGHGETCKSTTVGYNFKYSDIQSYIGLRQLQDLENIVEIHFANCKLYENRLSQHGVSVTSLKDEEGILPLRTEVHLDNPVELKNYLAQFGIEVSLRTDNVSSHPFFKQNNPQDMFNSEKYADKILVLPSGPGQTLDDVNYVCDKVIKYYLRSV